MDQPGAIGARLKSGDLTLPMAMTRRLRGGDSWQTSVRILGGGYYKQYMSSRWRKHAWFLLLENRMLDGCRVAGSQPTIPITKKVVG